MRASIDSTDSPVSGSGDTFRAKGSLRFAGGCGLIGAIWLILLGASAHSASASAGRIFAFVFAGLLIASSVRVVNLGVVATKDHVRIRNFFITRCVQWSAIEEFSFGSLRVFPAVGIATLRNERKLAITGISLGRVARKQARANVVSLITELNRLLEELRADAGARK